MEQRIEVGEVVPSFRLPEAGGRLIDRHRYRGRANLLLLFPPDLGARVQRYLRALSTAAARWPRDQAALIVAPAALDELGPLATEIRLPLLADVEGMVRDRYLPGEAAGGWFISDRWGELYAQGFITSAQELPALAELEGWLEFIACECR